LMIVFLAPVSFLIIAGSTLLLLKPFSGTAYK